MENLALKEVVEAIKQQDIVCACDKAGTSRKAYEAIYNIVCEALQSKKFYKFIIPQPKEVSVLVYMLEYDHLSSSGVFYF